MGIDHCYGITPSERRLFREIGIAEMMLCFRSDLLRHGVIRRHGAMHTADRLAGSHAKNKIVGRSMPFSASNA